MQHAVDFVLELIYLLFTIFFLVGGTNSCTKSREEKTSQHSNSMSRQFVATQEIIAVVSSVLYTGFDRVWSFILLNQNASL
mgnify:CR=1 FL=1